MQIARNIQVKRHMEGGAPYWTVQWTERFPGFATVPFIEPFATATDARSFAALLTSRHDAAISALSLAA